MSTPVAPVINTEVSSSIETAGNTKENADVTIIDEESLDGKRKLRDDPDAREAFLAEFSAKESKEILDKVDKRFFILIGLMFLVKTVCSTNPHHSF
jgi:hypothetical protein